METIPLKRREMQSCLKNLKHVKAMIAAMEKVKLFTIETDWEAGTVLAYYTTTGKEVFRAIEKGEDQPWIVVHHKELFA